MPTDEKAASDRGAPPTSPLASDEFAGAPFPYMRWAKAHLGWDPRNLGMSGVASVSAAERRALGLAPSLEVGDPAAALKAALAARSDLEPANVHLAAGTSHANFAVYLAFARGGSVAAEVPAYQALHALAPAVGATLTQIRRDPARGWRFDPASLEEAVGPQTSLIALTDLHNPSGARLHPADLELLLDAARRHDAVVLVDEVYADFDPVRRPSAALWSSHVVTTNSLTKVHGLSDLRAGWILGSPERIEAIAQWDDLVHPVLPPGPMQDALAFLPQADERVRALRALAAERADQVDAWIRQTTGVSWTRPDGGITGLVRLSEGRDGDVVARDALDRHGVRIVPGSFFQMRDALRLSFLLEPGDLDACLAAITDVLGAGA